MPETRQENKSYVLDFTYNDNDTCALTVLINDVRFHITVDPADFQKCDKPLYYEYLDKISNLRDAERREGEEAEKAKIVGKNNKQKKDEDNDQDSGSAQAELRNWILDAFKDLIKEWASPDRDPISSTLHEWYHGPTYFYSLQIKSGILEPQLQDTTDDLTRKIDALVPTLHMPKYIQDIDVPWLNAHDLTVQAEITSPEPAHPGLVTHKSTGEKYFFKPVILDIKVPRLLAFVASENSKTEIMGMLLTPISAPQPLTTLLSTSIPSSQRQDWATKSEKYVHTLHSHGIIWGDAKADNFMVDDEDELWIIDFGGSYTEGWVDPELSETKQGDEMGLGKIVKALGDPEGETFDPEEGNVKETASSLFVTEKVEYRKRKRNYEDGEGNEKTEGSKRRKEDAGEEDDAHVDDGNAEE